MRSSIERIIRSPEIEKYIFDPLVFDAKAAADLKDSEDWYKRNWENNARSKAALDSDKQDSARLREWSENYSGRVRKSWGETPVAGATWHYIKDDIEDLKVQLTDDEIDAAIDYPLWDVSRQLGKMRTLTKEQLTRLATSETMLRAKTFEDDIREAQLTLGVDPQVVDYVVALNRYTRQAQSLES